MKRQHRNSISLHSPKNSNATSIIPILGRIISLLTSVPAVLSGCSDAGHPDIEEIRRETGITLTRSQDTEGPLDIFVFDDDRMQKLDCYLRLEDFNLWKGGIISGSGSKIISMIAGTQQGIDRWTGITSRPALMEVIVNLEDECDGNMVISGETSVSPEDYPGGRTAETAIELRPLASEIVLHSLSCDFSDRPYAGEKLRNVKVYLTNVNAQCGILDDGEISPSRIINYGRLSTQDLARFRDKSMIYRELTMDIGKDTEQVDLRFRCYPNNAAEETPGTPFTRMVIEGEISGNTFYWPIDINREDACGIDRNRRYCYDIRITRKGSYDPDTPVCPMQAEIKFEIKEWKEMEECEVLF